MSREKHDDIVAELRRSLADAELEQDNRTLLRK